MSKIKQKVTCDVCKKKVHTREKSKVIGKMRIHYLWCASCKSVFPSYIDNDETREVSRRIEKLREEVNQLKSCPDKEARMESSAELYRRILNLQKQNAMVTKRLVRTNLNLFEGIGNRIIYK